MDVKKINSLFCEIHFILLKLIWYNYNLNVVRFWIKLSKLACYFAPAESVPAGHGFNWFDVKWLTVMTVCVKVGRFTVTKQKHRVIY